MYESLKKYSGHFHLYIFTFDNQSYELLNKLNLDSVTLITLSQFEDKELLKIKKTRSIAEYCWTCTPSIIKYSIVEYQLESCTYLDADLWFFSNPDVLIKEMKSKSVLITEHRYTKDYDQSSTSGIYCVQFMTFVNNTDGMRVLNWWREQCINWCFAKYEDGKFGDQKYLDNWTEEFNGIHVLQNLGGGVAPWNIQQYDLSDGSFKLVFYHFHDFKFLINNKVDLGSYKLKKIDVEVLYKPYINHLDKILKRIKLVDSDNDFNGIVETPRNWKTPLRIINRKLKGAYNVHSKDQLIG